MKEFFEPSSIAVVGATPKVPKPGYVILTNLKRSFKGRLYAVNPKYEKVLGVPCYKSLREIPDNVDLAVVVVPTHAVEKVVDDAIAKGVKAVIIITAGFSEVGNKELEKRVTSKLRANGIRVIGPNCLGVYYGRTGVDTFFFREPGTPRPPLSDTAIISQSGALAASILDWASVEGIGIGAAVSLGNKADVNEVEVMEYLASKEFNKFLLYVEGLRAGEGEEFLATLAELSSIGKRIGIYKGGRTKASERAVSSHTASVAGDYKVYRDLVSEYGAIALEDFTEVVSFLSAFQYSPPLRGTRALVVTDAGGVGVMLADALPLDLPRPVSVELESKLPDYVKLNNPMDVGGDADDERYRLVLEYLAPKYDLVIVVALMESPATTLYLADIVKESMEATGKPHLLLSFGGVMSNALEKRARELGIPFSKSVDEAVAFSRLLLKEMTSRKLLEVRTKCY
ncbi:CoA-binding protein [Ignicoccus islandicus DSM 13165]|uniref:CoA-binding protein n=1 Tax=Ignicoccus islandicus DSM 13165 TaxID=940295 RepID=A0A0U3FNL1_9CREN|nr:CoA-binding protein [Ignicoccus islandicus]ALU11919.1 CoA-binding protein [Ignicoccus islandicus DSM 13165]